MSSNFEKDIIRFGERQELKKLEELIKKTPTKEIIAILTKKIGKTDATCFWNYLLRGFINDDCNDDAVKEKRFLCVKAFLKQLSSIELSYKQTYDLLTRLLLDLPTFKNDQLIEIVEFTIDWMKIGDPKCVGWKDLLPEAVNILSSQSNLDVNSTKTTGIEYRSTIIKNVCSMKWPLSLYTPIANMFRDMKLTNEEITGVLRKFCLNLYKLDPTEIPGLSFQLFSLCNTASQIIIPIIALEKYFYKHYYKKLYADMQSESTDLDSIDPHSDKELREAEETVLHHLSYCTQFKLTEIQLSIVLRKLSSCPSTVLTPFILSSILSMTKINRDPDTPLTQSILLPLLRNIIKNNEDEKDLYKKSAWFRDAIQTKEIDLEQIFIILIDQNKDGKDVITPGLVNLIFVLLKMKNSPKLNSIAIQFLQKFIKKRFIFGHGIIKNLAEWMITDQEALQYSECLTTLSLTDTFTISECTRTIKYVLDFFLWIPGHNAMRMMSFILPIVKTSHTIRDTFIDVLKKAIYSRDLQTCCMGVHGFCMLLKQLRNNNAQRSTTLSNCGGILTQQSISGYSLMSQITLGNKSNPQRHFDMLALEIIGVLRAVFTKPLQMKQILYEDLKKAIEFNLKLTPHILQFIERHFRSYFDCGTNNDDDVDNDDITNDDVDDDEDNNNEIEIKFDQIIRIRNKSNINHDVDDIEEANNCNEIEILDDLGRLTMFVADCVIICSKHEQLNYNPFILKKLFKNLIKDITTRKNVESFGFSEPLSHEKYQISLQVLGFIEALMYYSIWTSKPNTNNCDDILSLFKLHRGIREKIKTLSGTMNKKQTKKHKNSNDATTSGQTQNNCNNVTINGNIIKKLTFKPDNIWDLPTLERFQRLLHEEMVSFASKDSANKLRSNRDLVCYVLEITSENIESLRSQPDYKQVTHSKSALKNLIDLTKIIYDKCIKRLTELWSNFDVRAAYLCIECFKQSLLTADQIFKRKFTDYINQIDFQIIRSVDDTTDVKTITKVLHETIESAIRDEDELIDHADGKKIPYTLMQCLEILYDNLAHDDQQTLDSYKWIFKFCETYELQNKEFGIIHKLLFNQRHKTHLGQFYNSIAMHIEKIFGQIDDEIKIDPQFKFKSITEATVESCTVNLMNVIRQQIDEIEYFISKCKSTFYKIRITPDDDHHNHQSNNIDILKSMEKSITTQLIHICETLIHLTNACLPLGTNMDNLMRLLMQYYICLTNLTKHFIIRYTIIPVSFQGIKFDQLLKISGKPLAKHVYSLITYIEANILDGIDTKASDGGKEKQSHQLANKKSSNPQADKAKVLRDTKFIPKLILRIENFNKFVILLSKKTKNSVFTHYLHMGTVRDFRIKTSELKDAIAKTLKKNNDNGNDDDYEAEIDEIDRLSDGNDNDEDDVLLTISSRRHIINAESETDIELEKSKNDKNKNRKTKSKINDDQQIEIENEQNEENSKNKDDDNKRTTRQKQRKTNENKNSQSKNETRSNEKNDENQPKTKMHKLLPILPNEMSSTSSVVCLDDINLSEPSTQGSNNDKNSTDSNDIIHDSEKKSESQLLRNLKDINEKTRKRRTADKKKPADDDIQQPIIKRSRKSKN